jgi:hypothetical protein
MHPTPAKPTKAERLQGVVLTLIVLLVGCMAGAASFSHVHDWTMENSPTETADWVGWANAVITELVPTAALIIIGQRRKSGKPIGYPMFLLIAAVGVSLTAQLAVAEPTAFGWMVSALPALAFFALSKLVFTASRPPTTVPAPTPATAAPAPSPQDTAPATVRPAADITPATNEDPIHNPAPTNTPAKKTPAKEAPELVPAEPTGLGTDQVPPSPSAIADLLPGARIVAEAHKKANGEPITAGQLAVRLRVPTPTATDILTALTNQQTANHQPHNGSPRGSQ